MIRARLLLISLPIPEYTPLLYDRLIMQRLEIFEYLIVIHLLLSRKVTPIVQFTHQMRVLFFLPLDGARKYTGLIIQTISLRVNIAMMALCIYLLTVN